MTTLAGQGDKISQPQEIILSCPKKKVLIPANVDLIFEGSSLIYYLLFVQNDHHCQVIIKGSSLIDKHDPAIK